LGAQNVVRGLFLGNIPQVDIVKLVLRAVRELQLARAIGHVHAAIDGLEGDPARDDASIVEDALKLLQEAELGYEHINVKVHSMSLTAMRLWG
jgi:hypothetical protein